MPKALTKQIDLHRRNKRERLQLQLARVLSKALENLGCRKVAIPGHVSEKPLSPDLLSLIRNICQSDMSVLKAKSHSCTTACSAQKMCKSVARQSLSHNGVLADISELNLAKGSTIIFPDGNDKLLRFEITLRPDEGIYRLVCKAVLLLG